MLPPMVYGVAHSCEPSAEPAQSGNANLYGHRGDYRESRQAASFGLMKNGYAYFFGVNANPNWN